MLELLPEAAALYDSSGRVRYCNRLLLEIYRGSGGDDLHQEVRVAARRIAARTVPPANVEEAACQLIPIGDGRYSIRGRRIEPGTFGGESAVLLVVRSNDDGPGDETLRERYRLTPTEIRVARLLADGRSNTGIAATLFVSPHTVRHHTERILAKLGVRSRAAVGPVLRRAAPVCATGCGSSPS
jgi:DNA-binding NarL/FixJ family response regulator